jgi:DNA-nicking Smr family endonuclease
LDDSFAESLVFVRIITGHGKSSAVGYSVLYSEVKNMLQRLSEGRVYDYSFTPHTGYFDVFLRYERH